MPSDYVIDLIDHKERVAKYMRAATDYIYATSIMPIVTRCLEKLDETSPLMDYMLYYKKLPISGQLGSILQNTYRFIEESGYSGVEFAILSDLFRRAAVHDHSKFSSEEFELYEQAFPDLQRYAYGTDEFRAVIETIKPAIEHHYLVNDHHPEYFKSGISGMHCIQLIEMCCDWIAASERSQRGIYEGLEINRKRFGINDQLDAVIKNTVIALRKEQQS